MQLANGLGFEILTAFMLFTKDVGRKQFCAVCDSLKSPCRKFNANVILFLCHILCS